MEGMIEIMKSTTIEMVRDIREKYKDGSIIDFVEISSELMSALVVNVCVGHGRAYDLIDYKTEKGTEKIPMYQAMINIIADMMTRPDHW
eukprot:CAMPEP_0116878622 /NCGR_PEP_ID=MMETSP0463-20121206/10362_1 /TAXON_ID=181622 /ORGANISM="Strombidinopsis sp, Strain SopsisLIS2011" /LENGTH=88 /DNA_ID=CAMNT_0004527007 /DNA_START=380 /DNA_END=643 /DNA_ORIENTATION=-